ncbi:ATP-binding cassette domain-containing protein [Emcibacter sp. SYSU 3D8]|uniref:ABC transporter ATP-binding protein n=1 Tax=Emcibacter sp. SYSU 3D8 TaxID=3133969 RepID=UPI0031FEE069
MTSLLLDVDHLTMRFGGLTAISDLSFQARRGEITAIIGPNGAGKTTVFNCLTGFYRPGVGKLELAHDDNRRFLLERMSDFRIARDARVLRTFQNIRLFTGMSVLENLVVAQHLALTRASGYAVAGLLNLPVYRRAAARAVDRARYWLDKIGLTYAADDQAGSLPYGSQRRLEIARALCAEPVLLCLDEPAAGLNPRESDELSELLLDIRRDHGLSLLLIEHDMSVVMQISDHVVVLDHGASICQGPPERVRSDPAVISAYLGMPEEEAIAVAGSRH